MADRIVTWRALADFSSVRKEAAKTQASLAALQAQVDENNASNSKLGRSESSLAAETSAANSKISQSVSQVVSAKQKAEKASTSLVTAQRQEISSNLESTKSALQAAQAKQKEATAAQNVQSAIERNVAAKRSAANADKKLAAAEQQLAKLKADEAATTSDVESAEKALTKARNAQTRASQEATKASQNLQRQQLRQASVVTSNQLSALKSTEAQIRAEKQLAQQLERTMALRAQADKAASSYTASRNAPQISSSQYLPQINEQDLSKVKQLIEDTKKLRKLTDDEARSVASLKSKEDSLNTSYANVAKVVDTLNRRLATLEAARARANASTSQLEEAESRLAEAEKRSGAGSAEALAADSRLSASRIANVSALRDVQKAEDDVNTSRARLSQTTASAVAATDRLAESIRRTDSELRGASGGGNGFTRILDGLANGFDSAGGSGASFGKVLSLLKFPAIIGGIYELLSALSALVTGFFEVASAAAPALETVAALGPTLFAAGAVAGTVGAAFRGVITTLKAYSTAQRQAIAYNGASAKSSRQQAEAITNAQEALAKAKQNVKDTAHQGAEAVAAASHDIIEANRKELESEKALDQARKDALQNILQLKNAVVDAALAERGATLDLASAQANLQQVMNDPNSTRLQRQQAQLQVDQAKQSVVEAQQSSEQAQQQQLTAVEQGVSGNPSVVQAKQAVKDSKYTAKQAKQKKKDALTQQSENNAQAVQAVTKAEVDLRDALDNASAATGSAASAANQYKAQLALLPPAGQKFVKTLISMKKYWADIRTAAANGLFPGLTKALHILAGSPKLLKTIETIVNSVGKALGTLAVRFAKLATSTSWISAFNALGKESGRLVKTLGGAVLSLADAFLNVSKAAIPLTQKMSHGFADWAKHIDDLTKGPKAAQKMTTAFSHAYKILHQLGQIVKNIARGFFGMGKAAQDSGKSLLDSIQKITKKWADWTNSIGGRSDLHKFFYDVRENLRIIDSALGHLIQGFFKLGANKSLAPIIKALGNLWNAIKNLLGASGGGTGNAIADIINNIAAAINSMAGLGSVLGGFINVLSGVTGALAWFLKHKTIAHILGDIAVALGAFKAVKFVGTALGIGKLARGVSTFTKSASAAESETTGGKLAAGLRGTVFTRDQAKKAQKAGGANALGRFVTKRKARKIAASRSNEPTSPIRQETTRSGQVVYRDTNTGRIVSRQVAEAAGVVEPTAPTIRRETTSSGQVVYRDTNTGRLVSRSVAEAAGVVEEPPIAPTKTSLRSRVGGALRRSRRTPSVEEGIRASQEGARRASGIVPGLVGGAPAEDTPAKRAGLLSRLRARRPKGDSGFIRFGRSGKRSSVTPPEGMLGESERTRGGKFGRLGAGAGLAGLAIGGGLLGSAIDDGKGGVRSGVGGALEGASSGAMFGMMFGPEGAVAGALIGGLIGVFTKTKLGSLIEKWWKKDAWPEIKKLPAQIGHLLGDLGHWIALPFEKAFDAVKSVFTTATDFITKHWKDFVMGIATVLLGPLGLIVSYIATHFDQVKRIFQTVIKFLEKLWSALWSTLKKAWSLWLTSMKLEWQGLVKVATTIWSAVTGAVSKIWNGLWSDLKKSWNTFSGWISSAWKAIAGTASTLWHGVATAIGKAFGAVKSVVSTIWSDVEKTFSSAINFVTQSILNKLIDAINAITGVFHIPAIPHIPKIGGASKKNQYAGDSGAQNGASGGMGGKRAFAKGGVLPGYTPGRDVHEFYSPTGGKLALSGGEGILVPEATRALGGARGINEINSHFSSRVASTDGTHFDGGGIWGTLGSIAKSTWGGLKHGLKTLTDLARRGTAASTKAGLETAESPLRLLLNHIPVKMLKQVGNGLFDKVNNAVYNFIAGKNTANTKFGGSPVGGAGEKAIWSNLLAMGFTPEQAAGVMGNMQSESGFNPFIIQGGGTSLNPSAAGGGGYGLVQWTPGSKLIPYLHNQPPSVGTEISALAAQLAGKGPSPESAAGRALASTKTPTDAANVFGLQYERYAGGLQTERATQAEDIYKHFANSSSVQKFADGGVVKSLSPKASPNRALTALYVQGGLKGMTVGAGWTASLADMYKKRLAGVNATTDVTHNGIPHSLSITANGDPKVAQFEQWLDATQPTSYAQIWQNRPYSGNTTLWNNPSHRNALAPVNMYLSNPTAFENYRKNKTQAYVDNITKKRGKEAQDAYKKAHPEGWKTLQNRDKSWQRSVGFIKSFWESDKTDVASLRSVLGLSSSTENLGLWQDDLQAPLDTAMANALGITHPADWPHPWSGSVTSIEQAIADQDRANQLNKQWFNNLQTLADWGLSPLVDWLINQGVSQAASIASSAVTNKADAIKLNASIQTGNEIAGVGDDKTNIIHIVGKLSSGTAAHPFGLRDISSYMNVPDYDIVNLWDRGLSDAIKTIPTSLTSKLVNDVSMFRQGLFYANTGAIVPGQGDKDTVPAMLTPGEGVLNTMAMRMLGHTNFNKLNQGIPVQAFANGGIVLSPTVSNNMLGNMSSVRANDIRRVLGRGTEAPGIIELNTTINNPVGENSVLSMTKALRKQAAAGTIAKAAGKK